MIAVIAREGLYRGGIAARIRLRDAEGYLQFAPRHRGQIFFTHRLAAVFYHRVHAEDRKM